MRERGREEEKDRETERHRKRAPLTMAPLLSQTSPRRAGTLQRGATPNSSTDQAWAMSGRTRL